MNAFDVNIRSVYAMRSCELGYNALAKCCGLMNLPPPVSKKNFQKLSHTIRDTAKTVAEASMSAAIEEVKKESATDIGASVDVTWQRRGFSSLNGVVLAVSTSNFKVVDVEAMSRYCQSCASKEELEFDNWKGTHKPSCKANHVGSAGSMETGSVIKIFQGSVDNLGVRYASYYGDVDSKSYDEVKHIYPGTIVQKFGVHRPLPETRW